MNRQKLQCKERRERKNKKTLGVIETPFTISSKKF